MKKQTAIELFESYMKPVVEKLHPNDKTAICCAWNDFVDSLEKRKQITRKQANTWVNPYS